MVSDYIDSKEWLKSYGFTLSVESQIVNYSKEIQNCIQNGENYICRIRCISLESLIESRKKLLDYIKNTDMKTYDNLIRLLDLEKDRN